MNKTAKRIMGAMLALTLICGGAYGISTQIKPQEVGAATTSTVKWNGKTPKYIFMFIHDHQISCK